MVKNTGKPKDEDRMIDKDWENDNDFDHDAITNALWHDPPASGEESEHFMFHLKQEQCKSSHF